MIGALIVDAVLIATLVYAGLACWRGWGFGGE